MRNKMNEMKKKQKLGDIINDMGVEEIQYIPEKEDEDNE